MSIALDNSSNIIEGSGFIRGLSCMIFEAPEKSRQMAGIIQDDQRFPTTIMAMKAVDDKNDELDCCSSSSIGRNSDISERSDSDGEDDGEVQSSYKGPLDTLDALEEVLPIRRGISKFYSGKSKSFTSLADASSSSSIKEIAKPDNAYTRKRKNLIATSILMEKNQNILPRSNIGGISKRFTSSQRPTFNRNGTPTSSSDSITSENSNTSSPSPPRLRLPPLHPQPKSALNNAWMSQPTFSPRRAFSLMDLQVANDNHSSSISNKDESKKHH